MLRDKALWEKARTSDDYKILRDVLWDEYNKKCKDKEIPVLSFQDEMNFVKTGNRSVFESKFHMRRAQLAIYVCMAMLYPENSEYLEKTEDLICEICREYSWQLPAHRRADWLNKRDGIDLFAAETGMYLAEIKYMLIDRLNPLVIERITNEIKWRILDSFENEECWFEKLNSNWASVCGGGVGIAFMYEAPDRFYKVKSRIDKCMSNYLDGICDEGSTSEGISYWRYGFSFYVFYHEVLRRHTFGRVNRFENEKVKRLAKFFSSVMLEDNVFISFSDSSSEPDMPVWLMYFLKREYGIDIVTAENCVAKPREISALIRDFVYFIPGLEENKKTNEEIHLKELQWYIKKGENYSFAVKAGDNGEMHNHNDIGSFIVTNNGRQVLCDLGAASYNAKYFGSERYTFINASSRGHSVPIVNGKEQATGKEFFGTLTVSENVISVDMQNAYPESNGPKREFSLTDDKIILTDRFEKGVGFVERLVTEIEPVIEENAVILDKTKVAVDSDWTVSYTVEFATDETDEAVDVGRNIYLIDFVPKAEKAEFKAEITFIK